MNCHPSPETTCGTLLNDSCVVITGAYVFPCTYPSTTKSGCYRQSEFNEYVGPKICDFEHRIGEIEASIDLSTLSASCLTPVETSVHASLQQLLTKVCALETNLDMPLSGLTIPDCIEDPCGDPISTLGQLLTAIMAKLCTCCPS